MENLKAEHAVPVANRMEEADAFRRPVHTRGELYGFCINKTPRCEDTVPYEQDFVEGQVLLNMNRNSAQAESSCGFVDAAISRLNTFRGEAYNAIGSAHMDYRANVRCEVDSLQILS